MVLNILDILLLCSRKVAKKESEYCRMLARPPKGRRVAHIEANAATKAAMGLLSYWPLPPGSHPHTAVLVKVWYRDMNDMVNNKIGCHHETWILATIDIASGRADKLKHLYS
jgi:hypothetical protein